jgi:hypothetical protein
MDIALSVEAGNWGFTKSSPHSYKQEGDIVQRNHPFCLRLLKLAAESWYGQNCRLLSLNDSEIAAEGESHAKTNLDIHVATL